MSKEKRRELVEGALGAVARRRRQGSQRRRDRKPPVGELERPDACQVQCTATNGKEVPFLPVARDEDRDAETDRYPRGDPAPEVPPIHELPASQRVSRNAGRGSRSIALRGPSRPPFPCRTEHGLRLGQFMDRRDRLVRTADPEAQDLTPASSPPPLRSASSATCQSDPLRSPPALASVGHLVSRRAGSSDA